MESVDLDMGEIFGEDGGEDEDIGAVGTLPDLPDATQSQEGNEDEDVEVLQRLKDLSKGAAKKVIRRPQPKLDPTRLTGERGIPILPKMFEKMKFKGKGHEAQDLSVIMRCLEHWSHRLFPKMPFDEVIERVEKLGSKKEVQTCVKKMRLDMPILDDDFVGSDHDEDNDERGDGDGNKREVDLDDMWDNLMREEDELRASQAQDNPTPSTSATQPSSQPAAGPSGIPSTPMTPVERIVTETPGLTPEQMERMERNKQLAREKKLRKMGIFSPAPASSQSFTHNPPPQQSVPSLSQSSQKLAENETRLNNSGVKIAKQSDQMNNIQTQSQTQTSDSGHSNQTLPNKGDGDNVGNEMSEVIEKEPRQNVGSANTEHKPSGKDRTEEAKDMDVGECLTAVKLDRGQASSDEHNVNENDSEEMSAIIDRQDRFEADKELNAEDSEEMSAVIDRQDFNGVVDLKQISADHNAKDSEEISDETAEKDLSDTNSAPRQTLAETEKDFTIDSNVETSEKQDKSVTTNTDVPVIDEEDKENVKMDTKTERANILKPSKPDKTVETKSETLPESKGDEFDDELNEDELMGILE